MTPTELDKLPTRLPISRAALVLQLSKKTIRRYIAEGRLTAYRVGKRAIRVDRDSLLRLQKPMGAAV